MALCSLPQLLAAIRGHTLAGFGAASLWLLVVWKTVWTARVPARSSFL